MNTQERAARREAKRAARVVAGTTRHLELPVPPDEALVLIREAVDRRAPMMRLLTYTGEKAVVSVAGSFIGPVGTGGNLGAAAMAAGAGIGVPVTWTPFGEGTQYTATAPNVGAMMIMRTEIQSLWRALEDAWDARERP